MKIGENGINLIKQFEGCSLRAYKCPAGVWTIGWGTTEPINGVKIHDGMTITQKQADDLLLKNLSNYEKCVDNLNVELNENQRGSLVSFCYNLGTGIFKGSLLQAIKDKDWDKVTSQMLLYDKARVDGVLQPLKGLTRRRKAEVELFLTPCVETRNDLADSVSKIIKSGIIIDFNSWKRVDLFNMNNVEQLLVKLGGVDKLAKDNVISDVQLWKSKKYNANNVADLLVKFANKL